MYISSLVNSNQFLITAYVAAGGGGGLFTDGGDATYLTSLTDDLAIGGSLASDSPFFYDDGN